MIIDSLKKLLLRTFLQLMVSNNQIKVILSQVLQFQIFLQLLEKKLFHTLCDILVLITKNVEFAK